MLEPSQRKRDIRRDLVLLERQCGAHRAILHTIRPYRFVCIDDPLELRLRHSSVLEYPRKVERKEAQLDMQLKLSRERVKGEYMYVVEACGGK